MNWNAGLEIAKERTREHLRQAAQRQLIALALATRPPRHAHPPVPTAQPVPPRQKRSIAEVLRRLSGWRSFGAQSRGGDA